MHGKKKEKTGKGRGVMVVNREAEAPAGALQTINASVSPAVRYEKLEGRDYMVVPMVMITEGVHNGSNGPLYYPASELSKTPVVWNHKPLVVYHPQMNGKAVSACEPEVISRRKVGLIMNTIWEAGKRGQPGKLKAEAWLETNRIKEVDKRVLNAIKKGKMVEVSTGLFTDNEETTGTWKGESYTSIARNYRPDHLAILPDEKGACSIADGAGLLRNSEMSFDEIRTKLNDMIREKAPKDKNGYCLDSPWVSDVYDGFCVYSCKGKSYKQDYTRDENDNVALKGAPVEVTRRQTYKTLDGTVINTGEPDMNKKALVDGLIANKATQWTRDDRTYLMGLPIPTLKKMAPVANESVTRKDGQDYIGGGGDDGATEDEGDDATSVQKKGAQETQNADDEEEKDKDEEETSADEGDGEDDKKKNLPPFLRNSAGKVAQRRQPAQREQAPQTAEEYIQNAPEGLRDVLSSAMRTHQQQKDAVIATITANAKNRFTAEYLQTKDLDELQAMAELAGAAKAASVRNNFVGMGDAGAQAVQNQGAKQEPLAIPTMTFGKAGK